MTFTLCPVALSLTLHTHASAQKPVRTPNTHPVSFSNEHTLTHPHTEARSDCISTVDLWLPSLLLFSLPPPHAPFLTNSNHMYQAVFPALPPNRSPFAVISRKYAGLKTTNGCVKKTRAASNMTTAGERPCVCPECLFVWVLLEGMYVFWRVLYCMNVWFFICVSARDVSRLCVCVCLSLSGPLGY